MPSLIELNKISYRYNHADKPILQDLDFSLGTGKVGLIGPNGSGKTTLFHLIMGLKKPQSGEILHHGKAVKSAKELKQFRREIGLLFQDSDDQLFSPTVWEDVCFGPLNLGLSAAEAHSIATATLEQLGLHGFEERITHQLSGGEKKLVALATILAMQPKLLLLDEPTNNLDPQTQDRLITILQDLPQSLLIISHDLDFLQQVTSDLCTIEDGKINCSPEIHLHQHSHIHHAGDLPHSH